MERKIQEEKDLNPSLNNLLAISAEISKAFDKWDENIKAGQQPVSIQDLDYWRVQIRGDVKKLQEAKE